MLIQSTRFGKISVQPSDMLLMPQGLIGFETCRHWIMLSGPENPGVAWLQSVGQGSVALPVISPRRFHPDYRVHVSQRQLSVLHLHNEDQLFVLTVVSRSGLTLTANLKSPILLNVTRQLGVQVVCHDEAPLAAPIGLVPSALQSPSLSRAA
jgi:flagellar assembly factor FliW